LDCFTKNAWSKLRCMWKPGKHASKNTHILVIQPEKGNYCRVYKNITKSPEEIDFYKKRNVIIQIFENSESKNCTKAVFQGSPESLQRCDPPNYVKFTRHSGKLDINVSWDQNDVKHIMSYSVRYKALGSLQWNESPGMSQNKTTCRVENLNSSVAYALQIHCITNTKCTQCPWSEAYTVPSEVTSQPVIVNFEETDVANEKAPVSGPANISSYNLTQNSMVLQWSSIPEEDTRGFLLGYTIHYTENHLRGTESENNITVDANFNKYELKDLTSGTTYQVQISGFTSKGTGKRSEPNFFTTTQEGSFKFTSIIAAIAVLAAGLIFGPPIIKRAKVVLWPSIPNPGKSNTMQKIDRPCELELLEAINTLKAEEWETKSLHIIEKEAVAPATILPAMLPLLCGLDKRGDSPGITCNWIQTETDDGTGNISPNNTTDTLLETQQTDLQSFPFPFPSGYTTMEMFQQVMPQSITAVTQDMESDPEDTDLTVFNPKPGLDYVRQFSTSPVSDSDHLSTIL
ncbi:protein sidekick-1, partial [Neolamprologus brichardi]|uniref:protein sidekick-1 n=1 Tax=Neolamprologus brichardi TaxID=32507 RepID=UPI001643B5EC